MKSAQIAILLLSTAFAASIAPARGQDEPITIESLLNEMTDRSALARFPSPAYTSGQFSSYDRSSVAAGEETWFANEDWSRFLRVEEDRGFKEWIMMDAKGPGCVTRIWATAPNPTGTIRIYLDDSPDPVIQAATTDLLGGTAMVGPPLSAVRARGLNFYLPIPYASSCKITYEGPDYDLAKNPDDRFWYCINYRTWPEGTPVASLTGESFEAARDILDRTAKKLMNSTELTASEEDKTSSQTQLLVPGKKAGQAIVGPAAIRELSIRLEADDLQTALRQTILYINCDDEMTVWSPVGDFFGSGTGLNPFRGWWRTVEADGRMTCRWIMPFEKICRIEVVNLSKSNVKVETKTTSGPWTWDDRSMHFHANWRRQAPLDTGSKRDWAYVIIKGKGVFVGDTLAMRNPTKTWWGEGDEKIFVDGEEFPSFFGTGTEDYYGYAFGTPERFEAPFHAQPRADGPEGFGYVVNTRTRSLDAVPFQSSLNVLMEIWHWERVQVDYAATTYWYGFPGARGRPGPDVMMVRRPVTEIFFPFRIKGVIEAETLSVLETTGGDAAAAEDTRFGWSGNAVLQWKGAKDGDTMSLSLNVEKSGRYMLFFNMARNNNYGRFRFSVDGLEIDKTIDLFTPGPRMTGDVIIIATQLAEGKHRIDVELVGANRAAKEDRIFALDYIKLESGD